MTKSKIGLIGVGLTALACATAAKHRDEADVTSTLAEMSDCVLVARFYEREASRWAKKPFDGWASESKVATNGDIARSQKRDQLLVEARMKVLLQRLHESGFGIDLDSWSLAHQRANEYSENLAAGSGK